MEAKIEQELPKEYFCLTCGRRVTRVGCCTVCWERPFEKEARLFLEREQENRYPVMDCAQEKGRPQEYNLFVAMLKWAISDLHSDSGELVDSAEKWFNDNSDYVISYNYICDSLGIDKEAFKNNVFQDKRQIIQDAKRICNWVRGKEGIKWCTYDLEGVNMHSRVQQLGWRANVESILREAVERFAGEGARLFELYNQNYGSWAGSIKFYK